MRRGEQSQRVYVIEGKKKKVGWQWAGERERFNIFNIQGRKMSRILLQTMARENVGQPPEFALSTLTI